MGWLFQNVDVEGGWPAGQSLQKLPQLVVRGTLWQQLMQNMHWFRSVVF
jgi:hypothetical protein